PPAVKAAPAVAAAPPPAASAEPRIVALADLPETLRRQLPALTVAGSVYSARAADRFVIINGQLLNEGGSPAPGLVIEQIRPRSAVLRWRETRFELPF
ncbi:MAG: general secretion pathway protein GspB, partial [Rubrivivax sp.]|nr:general secretion pathway protein GspB [Rubrivivax sp.]